MEESLQKALESVRDDGSMAINLKLTKVCQLLSENGLMYEQGLAPSCLTVHPQNRSGLMLNSFDVHEKGLLALKMGFQLSKVAESFCFEMSSKKTIRDKQVDAMKALVEASDKKLAPVNGSERFMSVSCSHISQFLKAVGCGQCLTENEELAGMNQGYLSLESLEAHFPADHQFQAMVRKGWQWHCIKSEVEECCPWLPQLLQAALNSGNEVSKQATEMEIALSLAYSYNISSSMENACGVVKASTSLQYVDVISKWVKLYGGGGSFCLVHLLASIQKLFNSSQFLGEEFMGSVSMVTFKSKETTYPMVRAALLACNLSSPKQVDGISKLLVKGDVEKLKSANHMEKLNAAESILKMCFEQVQTKGLGEKGNVVLLAKLFIRTALWLCGKEGKGREKKVYGSMESIHEAFKDDGAPNSSSQEGTVAEGGCDKVMPLEQNMNAAEIAQQQFSWLVKGKHYLKKDSSIIHKFEGMGAEAGSFLVQDIFGVETKVDVKHKDLKSMRPTDKSIPKKLDASMVASLQLDKSKQWQEDLAKADVQGALLRNCMEETSMDLDSLIFMDDCRIFASKAIKKHALKLFPFGQVQKVKEVEKKDDDKDGDPKKKGMKVCVTRLDEKTQYQVLQPKVDVQKGSGAIPVFFWVQPTTEDGEANMQLQHVKFQDWISIPCLRNHVNIPQGAQLMFLKEDSSEKSEPAKKKARK